MKEETKNFFNGRLTSPEAYNKMLEAQDKFEQEHPGEWSEDEYCDWLYERLKILPSVKEMLKNSKSGKIVLNDIMKKRGIK